MRKYLLNKFWSIYENDGAMQALSWLETLKYYEDYCHNDVDQLTKKFSEKRI